MGAGLCHWRVIIGFRGVASLALRRDRHAGVVLLNVRKVVYNVKVCFFGVYFDHVCYSSQAAIEAFHAVHRQMYPEIGPAAEMDTFSPEWDFYRRLAATLMAMPQWPTEKSRAGLSLLDGAVRIQCFCALMDPALEWLPVVLKGGPGA